MLAEGFTDAKAETVFTLKPAQPAVTAAWLSNAAAADVATGLNGTGAATVAAGSQVAHSLADLAVCC